MFPAGCVMDGEGVIMIIKFLLLPRNGSPFFLICGEIFRYTIKPERKENLKFSDEMESICCASGKTTFSRK